MILNEDYFNDIEEIQTDDSDDISSVPDTREDFRLIIECECTRDVVLHYKEKMMKRL